MESLVFFVAFFMLYVINELGKMKKSAAQPASGMFRKLAKGAFDALSKPVTKPESKQSKKPAEPQVPVELVTHTDWSVYDTPSFRRI